MLNFVCVKQKCFCLDSETFPGFQDAKFAPVTDVSRAAKLGNICFCSNVSATMFPSLARPLELLVTATLPESIFSQASNVAQYV